MDRNSKQETNTTHRYDDVIHMEYPLPGEHQSRHPKMSIEDRAKIFAPFAALKGYEDAITAKQKIVVERIELTEESREVLDQQLHLIEAALAQKQHPIVRVVYFQEVPGYGEDIGDYIEFTGMAARFDITSRILQIVDKRLKLEDIYSIQVM